MAAIYYITPHGIAQISETKRIAAKHETDRLLVARRKRRVAKLNVSDGGSAVAGSFQGFGA